MKHETFILYLYVGSLWSDTTAVQANLHVAAKISENWSAWKKLSWRTWGLESQSAPFIREVAGYFFEIIKVAKKIGNSPKLHVKKGHCGGPGWPILRQSPWIKTSATGRWFKICLRYVTSPEDWMIICKVLVVGGIVCVGFSIPRKGMLLDLAPPGFIHPRTWSWRGLDWWFKLRSNRN